MQIRHHEPLIISADSIWLNSRYPLKNRSLRIHNGKAEMLPSKFVRKDETPIRMPGVILPGLVDCHVHLGLGINNDSQAESALKTLKDKGIAAVRDAGDKHTRGLKIFTKAGGQVPLIIPAGRAISFWGYYGGFLGERISNIQEGLTVIDRLSEEGAKTIKLILTGLMDFSQNARVCGPYIKHRDIKVLTRAAHKRGMQVMAHVNTDDAIQEAVLGGIDSIEHGYFVKDGTLKTLAEEGIAWIPTLSPLWYMCTNETNSQIRIRIKKTLEGQQRALKKAVHLNVLVGMGTDSGASGIPFQEAYHREIHLYRNAGLTWLQTVRAACFNGYKILGLEHLTGPLIPADMLIALPEGFEGLSNGCTSWLTDNNGRGS